MIQKVKIDSIFENPENPRTINKVKFKKLVKSVREFPEMLKLRPIVVNKEMGILGGNMRFKACQELKLKEVYIIQATDLTDSQVEQFIIKDNVGYGDWEWDMLANSWDIDKLEDWGVNVPTIKNTELLSGLEYKPMYYEPTKEPNINLEDCLDCCIASSHIPLITNGLIHKYDEKFTFDGGFSSNPYIKAGYIIAPNMYRELADGLNSGKDARQLYNEGYNDSSEDRSK